MNRKKAISKLTYMRNGEKRENKEKAKEELANVHVRQRNNYEK